MSSIPGNLFQLQNVFVIDLMSEIVPVRNRHKDTFFSDFLFVCFWRRRNVKTERSAAALLYSTSGCQLHGSVQHRSVTKQQLLIGHSQSTLRCCNTVTLRIRVIQEIKLCQIVMCHFTAFCRDWARYSAAFTKCPHPGLLHHGANSSASCEGRSGNWNQKTWG